MLLEGRSHENLLTLIFYNTFAALGYKLLLSEMQKNWGVTDFLPTYKLLLSEMQKNWGVTDFVSEISNLKDHPNIEKSVFLAGYGSNVCMSKNIANESLEQNFLRQFLYEWVY